MKAAQLLACQWGTTSRQGSSFHFLVWAGVKLCPQLSETWSQELFLPKKRFPPKSALTQLVVWTGPEGSSCSTSLPFMRDCPASSAVTKITGMNDENWTLVCVTFFKYCLVWRLLISTLLLYSEWRVGRRWALVLWCMTQKHLFPFLFGILWGTAVLTESSYSIAGAQENGHQTLFGL